MSRHRNKSTKYSSRGLNSRFMRTLRRRQSKFIFTDYVGSSRVC
jgi:hypothetical protein